MEETLDDISGSEHSMVSRSSTISSKLEAYCPECDIIFTYEELLLYRKNCKAEDGWLCCENSIKMEGCNFTTTTNEDLVKHRRNDIQSSLKCRENPNKEIITSSNQDPSDGLNWLQQVVHNKNGDKKHGRSGSLHWMGLNVK